MVTTKGESAEFLSRCWLLQILMKLGAEVRLELHDVYVWNSQRQAYMQTSPIERTEKSSSKPCSVMNCVQGLMFEILVGILIEYMY